MWVLPPLLSEVFLLFHRTVLLLLLLLTLRRAAKDSVSSALPTQFAGKQYGERRDGAAAPVDVFLCC